MQYAPGSVPMSQPVKPIDESSRSAVSWAAIIAGALGSVAITMILLALGSGVGFASISPWNVDSSTAVKATATAAIWLIVVQWISAGFGGYLTGRLRSKWVAVHDHEIFFRDTAHGFLSWALASLAGLMLIASATASAVGHAAAGATAGGVAMAGQQIMSGKGMGNSNDGSTNANADPFSYYTDSLFRSAAQNDQGPTLQDMRMEADRILLRGLQNGNVSDTDTNYLAQLVSGHTGLSPADAERRVNDVLARVKNDETKAIQAVNEARKATAGLSIYVFLSMLIGAFTASVAAAMGGRKRDVDMGAASTY